MAELNNETANFACRMPVPTSSVIKLGHGSGGKMTANLIESVFLPAIGNSVLNEMEDAAVLGVGDKQIALTTDTYVVSPIFFPGGDIASLSVHGTVNDLAMRGATPLALTAAFILEEGFSIDDLSKLMSSMKDACVRCNVSLVAADTKVVGRGAADKIFITTTGMGLVQKLPPPSVSRAKPGDHIIISGDIGRHGVAIMAQRAGLELETTVESDSAPVHALVDAMLSTTEHVHCLRDITRGGLAGVLNEIAQASSVGVAINESSLSICSEVQAVCELLGLDPLFVACEGRFVAIVSETGLCELEHLFSNNPEIWSSFKSIGRIVENHAGRVVMKSVIGGNRIVDKLAGEQLPRIC